MHSGCFAPAKAPRRTTRGFTLVELLVVIGIIALLISILMPALSKARAQGQWAVCLSNMKQLGTAMTMYAGENKQQLPRPASATTHGPQPDDFIFWQDGSGTNTGTYPARNIGDSALAPMLGGTAGDKSAEKLKTVFRCPTDVYDDRAVKIAETGPYRYTYTMNRSWELIDPAPAVLPTNKLLYPRPRLSQCRRPAEKVLMVEEQFPNDGRWEWNNIDPTGSNKDDLIAERHAKQANFLFADMHVERKYWKEMKQDHDNRKTPFEPQKQ